MNVVIIGAGTVGLHMANLLSKQNHNVLLIDKNGTKLEEASWEIDVAIRQGSGTDWQLLNDLLEMQPDFLLALTNEDEINLVTCSIAKQLGYPKTIARVRDNRFLNRIRLDFARLFNVDYFISPELLVAYDIYKYMMTFEVLQFETFAHGAVHLQTIQIPPNWPFAHQSLRQLKLPKGIIVGLIYRSAKESGSSQLIFPHGTDVILPGDEVTLIGEKESLLQFKNSFGFSHKKIESVVILGGSLVGINLAKILIEHQTEVRLIDKDHEKCLALARELPHCQVLHHEGVDLDFLLSEKVNQADYFISCTSNDELNVLGALVAKEAGCERVAIMLANDRFVPLVNRLGIAHVVSPRMAAASRILSLAASQGVTSLISLYDNEAEILELTVSLDSKIIGIPLADLGPKLPKNFLIAMIQSHGQITVATGESIICPGDTVIVICHVRSLPDLSSIF